MDNADGVDLLDAVLEQEMQAVQEAAADGRRQGLTEGFQEAYHFGLTKGTTVGRELGRMMGLAVALQQQVTSSARLQTSAAKLIGLIRSFPLSDPTHDGFSVLLEDIRVRFRALMASMEAMRLVVWTSAEAGSARPASETAGDALAADSASATDGDSTLVQHRSAEAPLHAMRGRLRNQDLEF